MDVDTVEKKDDFTEYGANFNMIEYADTINASSSVFHAPTSLVPWDMDLQCPTRGIGSRENGTKSRDWSNTSSVVDWNKMYSWYSGAEIELYHRQARIYQSLEKGIKDTPPLPS